MNADQIETQLINAGYEVQIDEATNSIAVNHPIYEISRRQIWIALDAELPLRNFFELDAHTVGILLD